MEPDQMRSLGGFRRPGASKSYIAHLEKIFGERRPRPGDEGRLPCEPDKAER